MIRLTPEEIMALGEARNHAPGISTLDGVLDEEKWAAAGNGPLPTPADIAAAVAAYRGKPKAKTPEEQIVELTNRIAALEAKAPK